ncbi:Protein of unknown function [Pyronema omphalodes CBS 100304]|uniref:Uncharacterized protein n=1 Tax=Pyronema omphalodes (strain CBS 100304) TaxID=1076935 RepID=U4LHP9_PYROM|nr:Protein of unknown function [Pyronema omphalodes CBS 100304]
MIDPNATPGTPGPTTTQLAPEIARSAIQQTRSIGLAQYHRTVTFPNPSTQTQRQTASKSWP